jgi:hypothetical protein
MPKYAIHHIVLYDALGKLLVDPNSRARDAGETLLRHMPLSNLGSIGPDLFFWAPDYEIVDRLYSLYKNYADLKRLYNQVVQPIRDIHDLVHEPIDAVVGTLAPHSVALIEQMLAQIHTTADMFRATASTGLFAGVIEGVDLMTNAVGFPSAASVLFQAFKPPLQDGLSEERWYWFDMLHYRRTGDFGRRLVENARNGTPQQRAYAYGYLSHIATDLVGHAYVNQVAGGPFRLQVQRHVTVENWMDTWKFQQYFGGNINLRLFDVLKLRPTLDVSVGDLLYRTLNDVYATVPHPKRLPGNDGFLTREQLDESYDVLYQILELMKDQAVARPEEPFPGVSDVLAAALGDFLKAPPAPPGSPSGTCSLGDIFSFGLTGSSRECYGAFFEKLEEWFEFLGELLRWTIGKLFALIDLLLAVLLSLPIAVLLAILYGIQLLMYQLFQTVRSTLALSGFVYPEPDDLNDAHGRNLITPFQCGLQGCSPRQGERLLELNRYPRLTGLSTSHLVCPPLNGERPFTIANFAHPNASVTPDVFINEEPLDLDALAAYAASPSPEKTWNLHRACRRIGNATDLTTWMIGIASDVDAPDDLRDLAHTNWNLDADRGYAYKTWEGRLPVGGDAEVGEAFTDT